jgi:hypothetical protein
LADSASADPLIHGTEASIEELVKQQNELIAKIQEIDRLLQT